MLRIVLVIHRYLAVAVGLLMALWCLSGFVMMYQSFPSFTTAERLATLAPLDLSSCCQTAFLPEDTAPAADFRIEMLNGRPVLRRSGEPPFDLTTGAPLRALHQAELLQVADRYAAQRGLAAQPRWVETVDIDQWSIQSARHNQPAHRIALDDDARTELYINGATGEIFQDTSRRERVLAWLGAIPHWLYPTFLRSKGVLWTQLVIWTAAIGTFLTLTGLYVGISRMRRPSREQRVSPFRGWWYWHHLSGLLFGVLALTWVFSGLLTVNPGGVFLGGDFGASLRPQLSGTPTVASLRSFLQSAPGQIEGDEYVQLRAQPFRGELHVLGLRADGSATRLGASGQPAPLSATDIRLAVESLPAAATSLELLTTGDAYYYGHKRNIELPVYRAILDDAPRTRLYISPTTGSWRTVDQDGRAARWLVVGLHSLDFPWLRQRPAWDIVTLLLLAGVTTLCTTGAWMALQRVRRDLRRSNLNRS